MPDQPDLTLPDFIEKALAALPFEAWEYAVLRRAIKRMELEARADTWDCAAATLTDRARMFTECANAERKAAALKGEDNG